MAQNPFEKALVDEGLVGTPLEPLARSIYMQESSSGQNTKTSNAGAVGGMQILPGTFQEVLPGGDINDPYQNSVAGLRYIKKLSGMAGGDPSLVAAGYYGGPGGMQKAKQGVAVRDPRNPNAPDTLQYAKQVTERQGKSNVSRGTPKAIQENIANLGEGYQAAYALMSMADEEPETEREREAKETAEEQSAAQQFAAIQKQLASVKPASPFADQEPQQFNKGGEATAEDEELTYEEKGIERKLAERIGLAPAWDAAERAPAEMGFKNDAGTKGDAVRHMMLMRGIEQKYGPYVAKAMGYAHEAGNIFDPSNNLFKPEGRAAIARDWDMDTRNNALGLELSKQAGGDEAKFRELMAKALADKQADYYAQEYSSTMPTSSGNISNARKMLKEAMPGQVRKRAEGSPEEGETKSTAKEMLKDAARGVSYYPYDLVGAPVDVINLGLKGIDWATGSKLATDKPVGGSEYLIEKSRQMGIAEKPTGSAAEELARFGSAFINPAAGARATGRVLSKAGDVAAKGAEKVGLEATRAITKNPDVTAAQMYEAMLGKQGPTTAAVRPKGGLYLGAQDVKSAPLDTFDQEVVSLSKNIDPTNPLDKSILDFFDKKVRKYVQVQRGTPDDPIFNAYVKGRLEPNTMMFRDYLNKAQEGDASSLRTARDYYDMSLGMTNIIPTKTAEVMAKGKSPYAYAGDLDRRITDLIKKQKPDEPSTWSSTAMLDPKEIKEKPDLYNFPGVNQLVQESEAGKLMRMLNKTDLPPHLRQAATSGEYVTHTYGGTNARGEPTFVGNLTLEDIKGYLQTRTPKEIKNMGVEDVAAKTEEFGVLLDVAEQNPEKFANRLGPRFLMRGTETVFPTTNDMKWVELKDREAIVLDGRIQKLCTKFGVGYADAVQKGLTKLYSLRNEKGLPHALISVDKDANGAFTIVSQVKGRKNDPAKQYFGEIDDFLNKYEAKINKPLRLTENDRYLPVNRRIAKPIMKKDIDENGVMYEREIMPGDPEYPDVDDLNYPVND